MSYHIFFGVAPIRDAEQYLQYCVTPTHLNFLVVFQKESIILHLNKIYLEDSNKTNS